MANVVLQKLSLRSTGIIGAGIFLTFFAFTFSIPGWVEQFAAEYTESEAAKRIDSTIDAIRLPESDSALARFAQSMYDKNEAQIEQLKANLRSKVHEQWAEALALVRDLDASAGRNGRTGSRVVSRQTLLWCRKQTTEFPSSSKRRIWMSLLN